MGAGASKAVARKNRHYIYMYTSHTEGWDIEFTPQNRTFMNVAGTIDVNVSTHVSKASSEASSLIYARNKFSTVVKDVKADCSAIHLVVGLWRLYIGFIGVRI
jgi:hypothetical protein